jgi:hypothetical protein
MVDRRLVAHENDVAFDGVVASGVGHGGRTFLRRRTCGATGEDKMGFAAAAAFLRGAPDCGMAWIEGDETAI